MADQGGWYGQGSTSGQGYTPLAVTKPGWGGWLERLGDRVVRRARPRVGIALAGVGMVMIVVGVVAWSGDQADSGTSASGDPDTSLGVILSLLVVAGGYALLLGFRKGPLAAAGVVASVVGVPLVLGFATFDPTTVQDPDVFFPLPVAVDAIALVSLAAWLASYAWVPVARGRAFYLAASVFILWLYVVEKAEEGAAGYLLTLPFSGFFYPFVYGFSDFEEEGPRLPSATTIGTWSLLFGVAYYVIAIALDRRGNRGAATPFTVAGLVTTALGIGHLAGDLEAAGTGIVLIIVGLVLTLHGATQGRRFTTWAWSAAAGLGVLLIVGDIAGDNVAGFGIAAIVLGAIVIVLAHRLTTWFSEPDEMDDEPSRFTRPPTPPRSAAPAPPGSTPF